MKQIVVVGCGVIGAMIAYELSQDPDWQITVLDRHPPAQASTGAALGVLMGIISQKVKGQAWAMRQASIQRYATLLPELEAAIGHSLPWNQQGILKLCLEGDDRERWQQLIDLRRQQGWQLEYWSPDQVQERCPQVHYPRLTAAIYSPQDYQIDPTALTLALVQAAQQRGVQFQFGVEVQRLEQEGSCSQLFTSAGAMQADYLVIAAGLGSTPLLQSMGVPQVNLHPVLGQAVQVRLDQPLGQPDFQPVITGNDIHLVPLGRQEPSAYDYWIGATVEFPEPPDLASDRILPNEASFAALWQGALELWPALTAARVIKTWAGLRPRPHQRTAPIVEPWMGESKIGESKIGQNKTRQNRVWIATGHYRNGVLLAPATAQIVRTALSEEAPSIEP